MEVEHDGIIEYYTVFPCEGTKVEKYKVLPKQIHYADLAEDVDWNVVREGVRAAIDAGFLTEQQIKELSAEEILYIITGVRPEGV